MFAVRCLLFVFVLAGCGLIVVCVLCVVVCCCVFLFVLGSC